MKNELLIEFERRTGERLNDALTEIGWWENCVARGLVTPEQAAGYISVQRDIVRSTSIVLGLA